VSTNGTAFRIQVENSEGKWTDVLSTPVAGFNRAVGVFDAVKADFRKRMLRGLGGGRWKVLSEADVYRLCGRKIVPAKESAQ
jgi:hypothetical protein